MKRASIALLALALTACAGSGAQPDAEPSSSPSSTSAPTQTQAPKLAPPKVRFAKAVAALRRSDPLVYDFVVTDSGGAVISAVGPWNPATGWASLVTFVSNPVKPSDERVGGNLLVIGEAWYLEQRDHCLLRLDRELMAERYGLTEDTLGLTAGDALLEAVVTGVSPGSDEVLEVDFDLDRVLAMLRLPDSGAGGGRVPGQVTVLDGRLEKWTIEGADLAESLAPGISARRAKALSYLALKMEFLREPTKDIRRPSRDRLAPDSTTPCAAADDRQA